MTGRFQLSAHQNRSPHRLIPMLPIRFRPGSENLCPLSSAVLHPRASALPALPKRTPTLPTSSEDQVWHRGEDFDKHPGTRARRAVRSAVVGPEFGRQPSSFHKACCHANSAGRLGGASIPRRPPARSRDGRASFWTGLQHAGSRVPACAWPGGACWPGGAAGRSGLLRDCVERMLSC